MKDSEVESLLKLKQEMDKELNDVLSEFPNLPLTNAKTSTNNSTPISKESQSIRELADKAKQTVYELEKARAQAEIQKEKYLKWRSGQGEVRAFGKVVGISPKIPVWLATIVIGGLIALFIYIANNPAQ